MFTEMAEEIQAVTNGTDMCFPQSLADQVFGLVEAPEDSQTDFAVEEPACLAALADVPLARFKITRTGLWRRR